MSAQSAVPPAFRLLAGLGLAGRRSARLRQILDSAVRLSGFAEPRADRLPSAVTIRLGAPGETAVSVIDRREGEARTYRFETTAYTSPGEHGENPAADLAERIAAVAAGRGGLRAKVLVDPASCFVRSLVLPSAALPRMRALLAEELEAATPFRAEAVYSDWFVEGENTSARTVRVQHVVLKKARLDPLLEALAQAGLAAGPVTVGRSEEQTMPVDLLSHGHRALPSLIGGARMGDLALLLGAALMLLTAFWGWRTHQDATLSALDRAFAAARRAAAPPMPAPVQAALAAIQAGRAPPLARTWDALAAALPDDTSAVALHLDRAGALLTVSTRNEAGVLPALGRIAGFGAPTLRSAAEEPTGMRRLVVMLPRAESRGPR